MLLHLRQGFVGVPEIGQFFFFIIKRADHADTGQVLTGYSQQLSRPDWTFL